MEAASTPRPRPLRVLVADDEPLFVESVEALLAGDDRIEVVGRAGNGQDAIDAAVALEPDVTLMDISMPVIDGIEAAIDHIERYGSHHTDAIITEDQAAAEKFLREVDSAIVLHNASTQFADGGEFGFGAEIGIATGRLHARGPVGVDQLTTFKYRIHGNGQTRP